MNAVRKKKMRKSEIDSLIMLYEANADKYDLFRRQVVDFFLVSKCFQTHPLPLVHSVKSRQKDIDHLKEKLSRKFSSGEVNSGNFFDKITDLSGVRVLHLHSNQFIHIHNRILEQINAGIWCFFEPPTAYSWDPEAIEVFKRLNLRHIMKESYYTSIHYVIKPQNSSIVTCEIQVRTLFEEIWGEIDHAINYPIQSKNKSTIDQIGVLARLASTGTKLADSIFESN